MENRLYTDQSLMMADRATRLMTGLDGLLGATSTLHQYREDGYVNVLNQYGTKNDTTEQYDFAPESAVMDQKLSQMYEGDGLFAKIIDTPSNECVKHGIKFDNLSDSETQNFLFKALDDLDWEESFATAVKWSRLFGGAIIVMLIDDGGSLDQPVNWKAVKSIDELRVYERAIVQPDWNSLYRYNPEYGGRSRSGGRFGMPEYFTVMSMYGSFIVHESRCLIFRNGRLPERCTNPLYRIWGMPEYIRIRRAMRDVSIAHGDATKLLERSVQAVYSMKGLADEVTTEEGENRILKRLQTIDTSRGLMNTISIDADGESYDFKTFSFSGISSVVDVSCNLLSAITNIPQTLLFGRSPAGMSATGESDMENYYNFVERIQKTSVKPNLMRLLDVVIQAGIAAGELQEAPDFQLEFNPLWSLSDAELAQVEATKAATEKTKADTAALYCNLQVLDPQEIRRGLASSESFSVEEILTDDAVTEEEFLAALTQPVDESENPQEQPNESTPLLPAQKQPQQAPERAIDAPVSTNNADEKQRQNRADDGDDVDGDGSDSVNHDSDDNPNHGSVGVIVVKDGKILCGVRCGNTAKGTICGPGGHIEIGESPEQAAVRETQEEFGITPKELIPIGFGEREIATGYEPYLFLCLDYDGMPSCDDGEMLAPAFIAPDGLFSIYGESLFPPFESGIKTLLDCLTETRDDEAFFARELDFVKNKCNSEELFPNSETDCLTSEIQHDRIESYQQNIDGGKGSGNFGHKGVPGQVGGSAPEGTGISITKFKTSGRVMDITSDLEVKASKSGKTTVTIKGGEKIDMIYTFAGKGSNKELRVANDLARQTNSNPKDWSHKSGFGNVVTAKGKVERAEIHWFENDKVGQIKFKVKKRG